MSDSASHGRLTLRLTDLGQQTLWATVLVLLASLLIPAFGALCTLVCLQTVGLVIAWVLRPKVSLSCDVPDRLIARQEGFVRMQVRNDSSRPAYDLVAGLESLGQELQPSDGIRPIECLMPGQSVEWSCRLMPLRRGRHVLAGAVCRSAFPLNLVSIGRSVCSEQTLLVLPAFHDLDAIGSDSGLGQGAHRLLPLGRPGTYPEYLGNRPYQPGDPPRHIDARAWARLSVPAVREFQDAADPRVGLFLERPFIRPDDRHAADAFEAAVSLTASLACSAQRYCSIEWLAAGTDVHLLADVPSGERFDHVHDLLAEVGPGQEVEAGDAGSAVADQLGAVSAVLFVLASWRAQQRRWVDLAQQAGCHTLVFVVADDSDERRGLHDAEVHWVSPSQVREGDVRP
jgi:uncharacterized protein (DUF58 family)